MMDPEDRLSRLWRRCGPQATQGLAAVARDIEGRERMVALREAARHVAPMASQARYHSEDLARVAQRILALEHVGVVPFPDVYAPLVDVTDPAAAGKVVETQHDMIRSMTNLVSRIEGLEGVERDMWDWNEFSFIEDEISEVLGAVTDSIAVTHAVCHRACVVDHLDVACPDSINGVRHAVAEELNRLNHEVEATGDRSPLRLMLLYGVRSGLEVLGHRVQLANIELNTRYTVLLRPFGTITKQGGDKYKRTSLRNALSRAHELMYLRLHGHVLGDCPASH